MHRAAHHAKECWGALRTKGMAACSRKHWNTGIAKLSGLATCPRSAANDARDAQHSPAVKTPSASWVPSNYPCTSQLPLLLITTADNCPPALTLQRTRKAKWNVQQCLSSSLLLATAPAVRRRRLAP